MNIHNANLTQKRCSVLEMVSEILVKVILVDLWFVEQGKKSSSENLTSILQKID
jgi:hypothetical protein